MKPAFILAAAGVAVVIGTEILRSIIHRRRERRDGFGGTQDIAMWGTFISLACFLGAGLCALFWR